jgi:hypothetical protein
MARRETGPPRGVDAGGTPGPPDACAFGMCRKKQQVLLFFGRIHGSSRRRRGDEDARDWQATPEVCAIVRAGGLAGKCAAAGEISSG